MRAASRRLGRSGSRRLLSPAELVGLGVVLAVLLPGLALTAISPSAWPVPAVAAVAALLLLVKVAVAPGRRRERDDAVAAEAATGLSQIETWLSQRNHT